MEHRLLTVGRSNAILKVFGILSFLNTSNFFCQVVFMTLLAYIKGAISSARNDVTNM